GGAVDVELVGRIGCERLIEPLVTGDGGFQSIAWRLAQRLIRAVGIVAVALCGGGEIKLAAEGLLEACGFAEEQLALPRILFVLQPGQGQLGAGQSLRQSQFAGDWGEYAFTVELDQIARIGLAETVLHAVENLMTNNPCNGECK